MTLLHCYATVVLVSVCFLLLIPLLFDMSSLRQSAYERAGLRISSGFVKLSGTSKFSPKAVAVNKTSGRSGSSSETGVPDVRLNISTVRLCPLLPPNLVGYLPIKVDVPPPQAIDKEMPEITDGGRYRPKECTARSRVAIIVPYRGREEHLKIFIYNIHRFLARQQIDYGIFVIEQGDSAGFNRAKLFNVGFIESLALYEYQCFIFHDVDLLPVDDRNLYTCPEQPRHMCVTIDDHTGVYYPDIFGGVSALTKDHMMRANGFSNSYWGWGAEDDDMSFRLRNLGLKIYRRSPDIARYVSLPHNKTTRSSDENLYLLSTSNLRHETDGLNSLKYRLLDIAFRKLYTWIKVNLTVDQ